MISALSLLANSKPAADFPEAVGPARNQQRFNSSKSNCIKSSWQEKTGRARFRDPASGLSGEWCHRTPHTTSGLKGKVAQTFLSVRIDRTDRNVCATLC